MGQITYHNEHFLPVAGVDEDGREWTCPPTPTFAEKLAARQKFVNQVDEYMKTSKVSER